MTLGELGHETLKLEEISLLGLRVVSGAAVRTRLVGSPLMGGVGEGLVEMDFNRCVERRQRKVQEAKPPELWMYLDSFRSCHFSQPRQCGLNCAEVHHLCGLIGVDLILVSLWRLCLVIAAVISRLISSVFPRFLQQPRYFMQATVLMKPVSSGLESALESGGRVRPFASAQKYQSLLALRACAVNMGVIGLERDDP